MSTCAAKDIRVVGLGFSTGSRVVPNKDFESRIETTDEWIVTRTGIRERRHVAEGESTVTMAAEACRQAMAQAGVTPSEVTHLFLMTVTADSVCPNGATQVAAALGLEGVPAQDLNAACSGFLYGLELARGMVALHPEAVVLVAAGETLTSRTNFEDRTTCVLFGDGAGAAVVRNAPKADDRALIRDVLLRSDGTLGNLLTILSGGSAHPLRLGDTVGEDFFIRMNGREVFRHAVRNMAQACEDLLARNGLTKDDVSLLVPHQANMRIITAVGEKLNIPQERVFINVERYGNTSAASLGIALTEALRGGRIKPGDKVLLTAFGAGFTWGAVLLEFGA